MTCQPLVAGLAAVLLLVPPALADEHGPALLQRSAEATRTSAYVGEALWIIFGDARPYVTTVAVRANGGGEIDVDVPERLRGGAADAKARHLAAGWAIALPATFEDADRRLEVLTRNYAVQIEGTERVMDRPSTVLALHRRDDGLLRERLWIDRASDLLVRRETYAADGALLRLGAFLSLDFDPETARTHPGDRREQGQQGVMPVDEDEVEALRKGGWTVPEALPGGYEVAAAYTMADADIQPLQVVYGDGLYTVSVFQQAGSADWESLPAGARRAGLPGEVYEWPGALPHRLVWTAAGRTWSVVGDAPRDDLEAIAAALPTPEAPGVLERLRRGFSRLWSGVSEWGRTFWD